MASGGNDRIELIETLLFYLRFRYLSATECLVYLFLYGIADRAGRGYVSRAALSKRFGRSRGRCQGYLHRLRRHGLVAAAHSDDCGGTYFKLEMALTGSESIIDAENRTPPPEDVTNQVSPAGNAPAPRQRNVGTQVPGRLK